MRRIHHKIDFVITWVDGADPLWVKEKNIYAQELTKKDAEKNSAARYRDMGLLKYWFRGVEQFAPWVNRIHFVTCGHVPEWLNTDHEKLHIVKHSDYIDSAYLPTFNSNAIELSMHKIEGLSEYFVYFNDDMYLTAPVSESHFFRKGLPCDYYEAKAIVSFYHPDSIDYVRLNNVGLINRNYSGRKRKLTHLGRKFSFCYKPKTLARNAVNLFWNNYIGFGEPHLPISYRKSDFDRIWEKYSDILKETQKHKFRTPYDINHWVFRYGRMIEGAFAPVNYHKFAKYHLLNKEIDSICQEISSNQLGLICLNDNAKMIEFEKMKAKIKDSFEEILQGKSRFER